MLTAQNHDWLQLPKGVQFDRERMFYEKIEPNIDHVIDGQCLRSAEKGDEHSRAIVRNVVNRVLKSEPHATMITLRLVDFFIPDYYVFLCHS